MFALAISNTVDRRYYDRREAMYMDIVHKYTKDEMQVFPQSFSGIVQRLGDFKGLNVLADIGNGTMNNAL